MTFLKEQWLNILLTSFLILLPWQTRWIYDFFEIQGEISEYGVMSLYATEVLLIVGLIVGYIAFGAPKLAKQNRKPVLLALLLLGYVFVVSVFSVALPLSMASFLHLATALLFFVALLDERVSPRKVTLAFLGGLVVPALLGMWQVFAEGSAPSTVLGLASRDAERLGDAVIVLADGTRVLRAYGPFPHPNIFGGYLAVGVVAVLAFLSGIPKAERHDKSRIGFAVLLMLFFGTLLLTASRSAVLGLVLGLGLSMLVMRMKNTKAARIAAIPIAVVVIGVALGLTHFAPGLVSEIRGGGELEERSLAERTLQYKEYPSVMEGMDWIFGNGFGTYVHVFADNNQGREVWEYQPIHNVPLLILAEIGLVGLVLVVLWSSTIDKMNFARFPDHDAVTAFGMGNVVLAVLFFDHYIWSSWAGLALIAFVMALTVRMGELQPK